MDILTQALLGSAVAQSAARKSEFRLASGIGLFAGLLADADVLIYSSRDPLLTIEYHRHFSHALLFIPFGALLACLLLWPLLRKRISIARLYLYSLLGYLLSGVLDALTSFGTYLYWPFSEQRVAWHMISIVDPAFTLVLLVAVVTGFIKRQRLFAQVGLLLCILYLSIAAWQLQRAEDYIQQVALQRGHKPQKMIVKPTLGNILLWRSTYLYQDKVYIDALRIGINDFRLYPGRPVSHFGIGDIATTFSKGSVLYQDVMRFRHFSDDYLVWLPREENVLGDIRYALLPDSNQPLWGIAFDIDQSQQHARFVTFRTMPPDGWQRFVNMLQGHDVPPLE